MATFAILFDHRPKYLGDDDPSRSLLTLPIGTGSVLELFLPRLRTLNASQVVVIPTFEVSEAYESRLRAVGGSAVQVRPLSDQVRLVGDLEGSDIIVTIDARYYSNEPVEDARLIETSASRGTAVYMVAASGANGKSHERIVFDDDGRIKRIRRLYEKIAWSHGAKTVAICGVLPQQLAETVPLYPIGETRVRLASQGTPSQDHTAGRRVFDLCDPGELLELNRQVVLSEVQAPLPKAGYFRQCRNVLMAKSSKLSEGARVIGPVVVGRDVTIEPGVTIIGPTVIGARCRLEQGALVARSILPDEVVVNGQSPIVDSVGGYAPNGEAGPGPLQTASWAQDGHTCEAAARLERGEETMVPPVVQKSRTFLAVKRAMDIAGAVVGLMVTLLFFPFIVALIRLESRGSIFFVHRREGRGGKEFGCLKFRTMYANAHEMQRELYAQNEVDGPQFNLTHDPRVTRVGRWLRKLNVDELPQLINVLRGEMSLVGPRPSPFRENQICVPWRRARLAVRPGITGLWQICRHDRGEGDFSQWICYDVAYVRNMSLWLDLKILFYSVISMGGWRPVKLERLLPETAAH